MRREMLMIRAGHEGRRETLATVRARIDELQALGADLDTPLVDWYNPAYLRDEIVVEIPSPPPAEMSLDELISEFQGRIAPMMAGEAEEIWNEIETRLRSRS